MNNEQQFLQSDESPRDEDGETLVLEGEPKKRGYWHKVGGGSLTISLLVHGLFVIIALLIIWRTSTPAELPPPEFLPGGGGGTEGNTAINKKMSRMMASRAIAIKVSSASASTFSIPDTNSSFKSSTSISSVGGQMSGTPGSGGGFGGGIGLGQGTGKGPGVGPGQGAGFVAMFGKSLKAKKLGVVLDISRSMHPYLVTVVREANKIGSGAPVVCYYGCGLMTPKEKLREKAQKTEGRDFDHFWHRIPNGPKPDQNSEVDLREPLPLQEVYDVLHKRKDTYFFEKKGIGNAWLALMAPELKGVDAVYWFADFRDGVDSEQLEAVAKEFAKRKQKLYVHSSGTNADSLQTIIDRIVTPSGGEQIKADLKSSPGKNPPPGKKKK